jgi:glycosyltransferase involved in cell wall biosynthesis
MSMVTMTYKERMSALRCVVIIPTYNNAGTVAKVISDVKAFTADVIVVNDGSTDDTRDILATIDDIRVIDYPNNKGKGYALKLGLKRAYEWGYRYAITIDSDGQHYADDIPTFIESIEQKPDSLLIGARNLTAENMPSKNTFANRFSNFWYKVETGQELSDTQSGFRLYPLEKLQNIHFITRRYEFEVEIIVRAAWRGVNVENVPIKVYYPPVEERVSHFRPLHDFTRISILNTALVLYALLLYYPWKFLQALTYSNIKNFIDTQIIHSKDSNLRMAAAMGWGVFCGIIPIWGYQMVFAGLSAHFMRLNKIVAIVFSNVSIPPMIPFILYGSMVAGAWMLNIDNIFSIDNVSLQSVGQSLCQYLIGSVALATISGMAVFAIALVMMVLCKRRSRDE